MKSSLLKSCVAGLLLVCGPFVNNVVRASWVWLLVIFVPCLASSAGLSQDITSVE